MSPEFQAALRERVKELTCLYGIAKIAGNPAASLEEVIQGAVELLPPAWQYPDIALARITLDRRSYVTSGFHECRWKQAADVVIGGVPRGVVEVHYAEERPELDEGPFLKEERSLIDAVARQVALIVEQRRAEEERVRLQDQVRHADRLATIGLLAAGVAHELNEPLGNILGFAQLAKKCPRLPASAKQDIEKIEAASLYARKVVKDLLMFARQTRPQKTQINLSEVVEKGLSFLRAQCVKGGIQLECSLASGLPAIMADAAQLEQVLVNLVVNALQAMPEGGKLKVETQAHDLSVSLIVEDTGIGMTEAVREQAFVPFFTTKGAGQGTGLGLSVVYGIVTSHGGSIQVSSEVGCGTRFEIRLPIGPPAKTEETGPNVVLA